jgi:hypothetical protein
MLKSFCVTMGLQMFGITHILLILKTLFRYLDNELLIVLYKDGMYRKNQVLY